MSWVMVSVGSLRNSSQVRRRGLSISPVIENHQSVNGVLGVGPADSTGKSVTRYWPGGKRPAGASSLGRPRKAREMKLVVGPHVRDSSVAPTAIAAPTIGPPGQGSVVSWLLASTCAIMRRVAESGGELEPDFEGV